MDTWTLKFANFKIDACCGIGGSWVILADDAARCGCDCCNWNEFVVLVTLESNRGIFTFSLRFSFHMSNQSIKICFKVNS